MHARVAVMLLAGVVMAGGMAGAATPDGSEPMKAIVTAYLDIQTQLVSDRSETVQTQAHAIAEQAVRLQQPGAAMAATATLLEKATDLKSMREAFASLSDAVVAAAKADGWTDVSGLKLAYCPMVRHSWLQAGDTLQNPYYGKTMAGCGEFRKMQ